MLTLSECRRISWEESKKLLLVAVASERGPVRVFGIILVEDFNRKISTRQFGQDRCIFVFFKFP